MPLIRFWRLLLVPVVMLWASHPLHGQGQDGLYRTLEEIRGTLKQINAAPAATEEEQALKRLHIYRYLAGVPYEDVVLDEDFNKYALAAARLCKAIGKLDHKPENPGLDEADYQLGLKGTKGSNLSFGRPRLVDAVDGWMEDSDPFNIEHLGHRRWCLSVPMLKVGFGRADRFAAMFCFDASRRKIPPRKFVAWPPAGSLPVNYFGPRHAWSVTLNPGSYRSPSPKVEAKVWELDRNLNKKGDALKLDHSSVSPVPYGHWPCVIFRPAAVAVAPGRRYLVEIEGLERVDGGAEPLRYVVEFAVP